ncbi:nitroreductase family deazaflavin-dependent oxidoreductase [Saccharomonospora xinjiangensis]|uniref:nitroreductase family deazaflavin-dependent oxidoreductase n=1 Tax=Saccharomonospora xinjiangensis TaxID=75294 RepID=UPI00350FDC01
MLFGDDHVRRYEETDGEVGYTWLKGTPILILTTKGRRSGQPRKSALIFVEHDGHHVVVASNGGALDHPAWYKNLVADPEVRVQVKADKFAARARTATGEERAALWARMAEIWPDYDEYQRKTEREIPVVVLERLD